MVPGSSSISGSSRGSGGPTTIIRTTGTDMIPALTAVHITAVKTATIPLTMIRAGTILLIMIETATVLTIGPPSQQKLPTSRTNWRQQVITMDESTASSGRKR